MTFMTLDFIFEQDDRNHVLQMYYSAVGENTNLLHSQIYFGEIYLK